MKRRLLWCVLPVLILAFSHCSGGSEDLPDAVARLNKSIETFSEAVLKNPAGETAVENALDAHISDLEQVLESMTNTKIMDMPLEKQQKMAGRMIPHLHKRKDKKLVSVYLLAQTNVTKLSLTNKKIEIKLNSVNDLDEKIQSKIIELLAALSKKANTGHIKEAVEKFGGKYHDAREIFEQFILAANEYAHTLETAKTPGDLVKGMNLFADRMEEIGPKMSALNEKYPELEHLGINPPKELKDVPGRMKSGMERLSKALVHIVPHIKDPDVQAAMKRVDEALKTYTN